MGTGYTRQSAADMIPSAVIYSSSLNAEFNLLQSAFSGSIGHSHDGTTGEGPLISLTASVTGVLPAANGGVGAALTTVDNTVPRFNGTGGTMQTSSVVIDDSNNVSGIVNITNTGTLATTGAATLGSTLGVTGAVTLSSTLSAGATTVTTFTSTGIDDNATGERLEISDTILRVGPNDTSTYAIIKPSATGSLGVSGGSAENTGSNIRLWGGSHATLANDVLIRSGADSVYFFDDSADTHRWYSPPGTPLLSLDTTTLALTGNSTVSGTLGVTGAATVGGTFGVTGAVTLSSTLSAGATTVTTFTSTGIDDNATGERLQVANNDLTVGSSSAGQTYSILRAVDDGSLIISGGTASGSGSSIRFNGSTHATLANDFTIRSGADNVYHFDDSADTHYWHAPPGTIAGSLTANTFTITGGQIAFPATQNPSANANTLDDYEEGTFTPTVRSNTGDTGSYVTQLGKYTKVGRVVHFNITIQLGAGPFSTVGGGSLYIADLPFTSANDSMYASAHIGYHTFNLTGTDYMMSGIIYPNESRIKLYKYQAAGATAVEDGDLTVSAYLYISGSYMV